jgi:gliding motility-associated lipoprotein GldH
LVLTVFLISSCKSWNSYHDNKTIENGVWNKDSNVVFSFDINDTVNSYDFYLNLRHSTDYKYSNIYFFIKTAFPSGQAARDTLEFILADKRGNWYGKGFGQIKDYRVLLRSGLRFPEAGTYSFSFEQAMREDELKGIKDIGISLEIQ